MIEFVIVSGTQAGVARFAPQLRDALESTRLTNGEWIERTGTTGAWAVAASAERDPLCGSRLAADGDTLVVINGPALSTDGDQQQLAANVLRTFVAGGSGAVADRLGGTFNFVGVAPTGGLRAFGDFSGMYPLYWHEGPDVAVFSNRSLAIARAIGINGWDTDALRWIVSRANLVGDRMPARDIRYVPPGQEAQAAWGSSRVRIERSPTWIWPPPSKDHGRDNLSPAEWDDVTDALVTYTRAIGNFDEPLRLGITGGKDSRLCLGLAKAAGLRDRITTFTTGPPDGGEMHIGRMVAKAAGFAFQEPGAAAAPKAPATAAPAATPAAPGSRAQHTWHRLRENTVRYEGIVCAWSALQNPLRAPFVTIKGFGGEFYRRGNVKRFRTSDQLSLDELEASFIKSHQQMDLLGIVLPEEAARQSEWLASWIHDNGQHVRADLLPEKFYVDFRLGHWSGPNVQCAPQRVNVNPLSVWSAAHKNVELALHARTAERFHFEVLRRAAPELVALPFFNDTWAPDIAADSPVELPDQPYIAKKPTPKKLGRVMRVVRGRPAPAPARTPNAGWSFLDEERIAVERLFADAARETDMGAFCDLDKLQTLIRDWNAGGKLGENRQMTNAVGVALTMLHRGEPPKP